MAPILYQIPSSPPVRAVLMVSKFINLNIETKIVDVLAWEHLQPWFLKLNPVHTVPVFVDDSGLLLTDSHAILTYIISKYAKDDSLYPKDLEKRAIIDQRLHFDSGKAFDILYQIIKSAYFKHKNTLELENKEKILEVYGFVETFLDKTSWVAGDSLTIADFSIFPTITSLTLLVRIDETKFGKLSAWLKKMNGLPVSDINENGLKSHLELITNLKLIKNIPQ